MTFSSHSPGRSRIRLVLISIDAHTALAGGGPPQRIVSIRHAGFDAPGPDVDLALVGRVPVRRHGRRVREGQVGLPLIDDLLLGLGVLVDDGLKSSLVGFTAAA